MSYSDEIKAHAQKLASNGWNKKDISTELGVPTLTLNRWCLTPKIKEVSRLANEIEGINMEDRPQA